MSSNIFGSEKGEEFNPQSPEDRVRVERNRIVFTFKKKEMENKTIIGNLSEKERGRMFFMLQ